MNPWEALADKSLAGELITLDEAKSVINADDDEILPLMNAAFRVRKHYFGKKMKLNMLMNAKSGHCPEDCGYCSQSKVSNAEIEKHPILERDEIVAGAKRAAAAKASTYCIVCSGRGPTPKTMDHVVDAVKTIKAETNLRVCACLGILEEEQAKRLKEAGVDRYNHNINTSSERYKDICSTHTYDDRVSTVSKAQQAGISACSGVLLGTGESDEDVYSMAVALRTMQADSVPVNFLHTVEGTPFEDYKEIGPLKALKFLAMFRFICNDREIRVSGGREKNVRSLQPLTLFAANSLFVGDYLTTGGQQAEEDFKMIEDMGFEIEGNGLPEAETAPETAAAEQPEPVTA